MKRQLLAVVGALAIIFYAGGCKASNPEPKLETIKDKVSYSIGLNIGKDFKTQQLDIDADILALGIKDALEEKEPRLTEEQMKEVITSFQKDLVAKQQKVREEMAGKNKQEGEAFLKENGKKEGVVTLPSGLQYQIIEEGTGPSPGAEDTVTVHYRGTLVDGTEFDSSYGRGEPVTFKVNGVIPGWTEALQLMKEGGKWKLFIPPSLAYGERGAGPTIGPNSTLVFEVELVSVKK